MAIISSTRPAHGSLNWDSTIESDLVALANAFGAWTSYNPAIGGMAGATITGEYVQAAHMVHFVGLATFGSSGSVGAQLSLPLPVPVRGSNPVTGRILAIDSGSAFYEIIPVSAGVSQLSLLYRGTTAALIQTSNSGPFTWGNGDQLAWDLWYATD